MVHEVTEMRIMAVCLLVVLCGCSSHLNQMGQWCDAPIDKATGRVIMLWLMHPNDWAHPDRIEPHVLENDYAMLILWGYGEKEHEFYLFDSRKRRYFYTEDLDCFLLALRQLPERAVVEWVQKCAAQFYYKMPDEGYDKIRQVLEERHTCPPDFQSTVCTCEAIGVRYVEPSFRQSE
jgi:hypothetical protein